MADGDYERTDRIGAELKRLQALIDRQRRERSETAHPETGK